MNALNEGQLTALRHLAEKRDGSFTSFVKIADAQHLTELGLASHSRQGWDITPAGLSHLQGIDADDAGIRLVP